ncbi:MAG: phosphatase PAP2 family protein [Clostridiales bacterium]|nr:phosphatase PAP2 family protein [Clostridiales bacterium]
MEYKSQTRLYIGMAAFFGILLLLGTFFDLPVSEALYSEDNLPALTVNFAAFYLFFGSCMFFLGALWHQLIAYTNKKSLQAILSLVFIYLFASTATLGGGGSISDPLLSGVLKNFSTSLPGCLAAGSLLCFPWFVFGFLANGKRTDKETIRELIRLIVIMTMVYLVSSYFNCTVLRPHYRLTLTDRNSVFSPWYHIRKNGQLLMSIQDLISPHPGSFICGHAMYAVLFFIISPAYGHVFPALKKKQKLVMAIALVFAIPILFCRLISGDNYLSDIALGGLSAVKICFSFRSRKNKNDNNRRCASSSMTSD